MMPRASLRKLLLVAALLAVSWPATKMLRRWSEIHSPEVFKVDFALYYATALQGRTMGWNTLYDLEAQRTAFRRVSTDLFLFPTTNTPQMALLIAPLTRLPLDTAYQLWSLLLLASLGMCAALMAPGGPGARLLQGAMVLVPYPSVLALQLGQVIALQMAALAISFALLRRGRETAAGLALLPLVLKPQGLVLVPFALLAAGRRRAFVSFALATLVLGAVVVAVVGLEGARSYLERIGYAASHPHEFWVSYSYTLTMHFSTVAGRTLMQVTAVALALVAAWRHREHPEIGIAAAILASLLASPYLHLPDLMLLFPAAWLVLRVLPAPWTALYLLGTYVFLLLCTHDYTHVAARWVLLLEVIWLAALPVLPRGLVGAQEPA